MDAATVECLNRTISVNGPLLCEVSRPAQPVDMGSCFTLHRQFNSDYSTPISEPNQARAMTKRNLGEAPEAATPVDARAHQQLLCAISVILIPYYEIILHDRQRIMLRYNLIQVHFKVSSIRGIFKNRR